MYSIQLYNPSKKKWGNPGTPLFRDLTPLVDFWDPQPNNCGATVGGGYGHWRSTAKKNYDLSDCRVYIHIYIHIPPHCVVLVFLLVFFDF